MGQNLNMLIIKMTNNKKVKKIVTQTIARQSKKYSIKDL